MRILHLNERLSDRGGADLYLLDILHAQQSNHDLHLAVGRIDEGVKAPCPTTVIPGLDARDPLPAPLKTLLEEFRPEILHVHNVMNPTILDTLGETPTLITVHDHRSFCPGRGKWTLEGAVCSDPMDDSLCQKCFSDQEYFKHILGVTQARLRAISRFRIHVLSDYMKREFTSLGIPTEQIQVIPPFVETQTPAPPGDEEPCVLFVGRLVKTKGVDAAMDAWERSGVSYPLVFAGTGPERSRIESRGFRVLGWLSREALYGEYRRAVALLLPSRWQEPFGIVGLEAMSFGVPVVAWRSGGIEAWHPGDSLVEWGDVDGLANTLANAVGTHVTLPSTFEKKEVLRKMEQNYRALLNESPLGENT